MLRLPFRSSEGASEREVWVYIFALLTRDNEAAKAFSPEFRAALPLLALIPRLPVFARPGA